MQTKSTSSTATGSQNARTQPCIEQWELMSANVKAEYIAEGFSNPAKPLDFEEWFASFRLPGSGEMPQWVAEKMKTAWDAGQANTNITKL